MCMAITYDIFGLQLELISMLIGIVGCFLGIFIFAIISGRRNKNKKFKALRESLRIINKHLADANKEVKEIDELFDQIENA